MDSTKPCLKNKDEKIESTCVGYSVSGYTTVKTDPKTGLSDMTVDAILSWKGTEKSWDQSKPMEFGWLLDTSDTEYRTEKAKFRSYPKGSKPSWDP